MRCTELLRMCNADYAVVPALFPTEVTNALLMAERRKRITADEVDAFLDELQVLDIRVHGLGTADMQQVLSLARTETLTAYDAAYLHLALELDLPLATFDGDLMKAASRRDVRLV